MKFGARNKSRAVEPGRANPVRSYVLRGGRLTEGQKRALTEIWPKFAVDQGDTKLDFAGLFGNRNPVIVEIGFGNGDSIWRMAQASPQENFLGVEVHRPGIGHLLLNLDGQGIDNLRVACADAVEFLTNRVSDGTLDGVRIFFPDPWPKKRHHKRRLVKPEFIALLGRKIRTGGILHLASDWTPYAEEMLQALESSSDFSNCSPAGQFSARPDWRVATRYERRGIRLGHVVHDLIFRRLA